jgi:hypothetical protein
MECPSSFHYLKFPALIFHGAEFNTFVWFLGAHAWYTPPAPTPPPPPIFLTFDDFNIFLCTYVVDFYVMIKAAISIGLACPSMKKHGCLDFQWHHWKSLGDCLWTSSDVTGSPKAVSGSLTSMSIGSFSHLGKPDLYLQQPWLCYFLLAVPCPHLDIVVWFRAYSETEQLLTPTSVYAWAHVLMESRVARWFYFQTKIPIWVNFGRP